MQSPRIAFICPVYGHFDYARRCLETYFRYSASSDIAIVVDDASPLGSRAEIAPLLSGLPDDRVVFTRFSENRGLTHAWNWGLSKARELGSIYAVAGNSDVLFTPYWADGLLRHLEIGFHLLGPLTNTPGITNQGRQHVARYYPDYRVTDDPQYLADVAEHLHMACADARAVRAPINGFFLMAKTDTWWEGAYDSQHVFDPRCVMVGNEDELERRWVARGWRLGFVPASFIFHYRSVTRGEQYRCDGWYRMQQTADSDRHKRVNLIYHVFPVDCPMLWFNLEQLRRYIALFNHRIVINVVSSSDQGAILNWKHQQNLPSARLLPLSQIERYLRAYVLSGKLASAQVELISSENAPSEAHALFKVLLPRVASVNNSEYTFFGHTKGVTRQATTALLQWVEWMYYYNLSNLGNVLGKLASHSCAGCFRHTRAFPDGTSANWHYSGTFFWLNHHRVFASEKWREHVGGGRWAAEAWLGGFVPYSESVCLFGDGHGVLYLDETMAQFRRAVFRAAESVAVPPT